MGEPFSDETQVLLDAADRAIARSRELLEQRHEAMAACQRALRQQEIRLIFLRERLKPK
jgi:hypothetical protein